MKPVRKFHNHKEIKLDLCNICENLNFNDSQQIVKASFVNTFLKLDKEFEELNVPIKSFDSKLAVLLDHYRLNTAI